MSVASIEPAPPTKVRFSVHDWPDVIEVPALHELDEPGLLFTSVPSQILVEDAVSADIVELLKGRDENDVARFFQMWVTAGWDFELAAWNQTLALYRTVLVDEEPPDEAPQSLRDAEALFDALEQMTENIASKWTVLA